MPVRESIDAEAGRPHGRSVVEAGVPTWGQIAGLLVLLVFVALSIDAYFGPGLRNRLLPAVLLPSAAPAPIPPRAFYEPGATVRAGQRGTGSEGQDRVILEGDAVLLGETGQLVRVGAGGRLIELVAVDGASTTVANLGSWDRAGERLSGVAAHALGDRWRLDDPSLPSVGAALHPPGAPGEALTAGFSLGPDADAGRVRRVGESNAPAIRLRASRKLPTFTLETVQPLSTLDGVLVSVTAEMRGQPGKTLVLTLRDAVAASGAVEAVADRRPATEEWTRLTVRRRVMFPSASDGISVGIADAEAGDWFEVRDLSVVLGVTP